MKNYKNYFISLLLEQSPEYTGIAPTQSRAKELGLGRKSNPAKTPDFEDSMFNHRVRLRTMGYSPDESELSSNIYASGYSGSRGGRGEDHVRYALTAAAALQSAAENAHHEGNIEQAQSLHKSSIDIVNNHLSDYENHVKQSSVHGESYNNLKTKKLNNLLEMVKQKFLH